MRKKYNKYEIYRFWGLLRLFIHLAKTKLFFPRARLIRFPIEIRGKKHIDFGINLTTGKGCRIEAFPLYSNQILIKFGNNIEINNYVHIAGINSVRIGNDVLIASKAYIYQIFNMVAIAEKTYYIALQI